MPYMIHQTGESLSFPAGDAFLLGASATGEVVLHLGNHLGVFDADDARLPCWSSWARSALACTTGEAAGEEGSNVLGFARYRNGSEAPSR
jgi:3-hydroxybutyryl-CoA dehydrogenase